MATREDVFQAIRNADAAGDSEGVRKLGAYLQTMDTPSAPKAEAVAATRAQMAKEYDPTAGMSTIDRTAAGVGKSVSDMWLGLRSLTGNASGDEVAERRRLDAPLMNTTAGMLGNVGGQIATAAVPGGALAGLGKLAGAAGMARAGGALAQAGTAAMAPTTLRGAAALGAATGAVQPAVDLQERAMNAGIGAAGSAGGMAALGGLSRVVRPQTDPNVLALLGEGVTPTPGQILGGGFKRTEEKLASVPILGDAIRAGQKRAEADLNRAAINRALQPIGETLPKGLVGRDAIEHVGDVLGQRYEQLLPKMTLQADNQFMQELISLRNMVGNGSIDPAKAKQFESLLQNQVLAKFQPGANGAPTLTGQTLKGVESDLGQLGKQFGRSPDPDQQMVGNALRELQDMLRTNVARLNPQYADELTAINKGYANFKRVQRAAGSVGAEDGVFTAAQLQSAVKALDPRKDKAGFASGTALLQDLADPAKAALGPRVPDSGTAGRLMMGVGAGGALGMASPPALAGLLGASAGYTQPGQAALAALLARRPDAAEPIASALQRLSRFGSLPALGASTQQR